MSSSRVPPILSSEEDRIEVETIRAGPPPRCLLPAYHRSNPLTADPNGEFQTTTLTHPRRPLHAHGGVQREHFQHHPSEMDLQHHHASVHAPLGRPPQPHHELRRPDSVITTSSLVSSSDTASQAGDCPPSVYAISGLYGGSGKSSKEDPLSSSSASSTSTAAAAAAETSQKSSTLPAAAAEAMANLQQQQQQQPNASSAMAAGTSHKMTHRRQASHPGNFPSDQAQPVPPAAPVRQQTQPSMGLSRTASGHRRSNSYGQQHRALTATTSHGPSTHHHPSGGGGHVHHHRRTASSVIETLQTLTCSGSGDDEKKKKEESIAQFLENLKKEQQEKYEKQELHEMQDELEDLRDCGLGGCRPKFIQGLANIKVFVFLLSLLVTLQQALSSGYLNSVITTIEKRYEIPSSISGIVASMYEIGNVGTVIFVSYLGSRRHIPTWIGMGVLVMGIGSITFSLPHFLSGHYMVQSDLDSGSGDNICRGPKLTSQYHHTSNDLLENLPGLDKIKSLTEGLSSPPLGPINNNYNREDNCISKPNKSSAMPIFIFMIAQLLLGCGGSPLFTLGTTYIDNHVKRDDSSMYIGIMYSMCAFGPVCGFLLGAYLLSHYVDTFSIDLAKLMIDSSDRHWIGMWWGGFLICGVALVLISIPFFFFPKELKKEKVKVYIDEKYHHAAEPSIRPKHKAITAEGTATAATGTTTATGCDNPVAASAPATTATAADHPTSSRTTTLSNKLATTASKATSTNNLNNNYGKDIKDIPRSTWNLLTNKIYMVTCMGACMELIIVSGFIVFLPKYLETQFNLGKSEASMFTGGVAIPGACIGIFLGGYILKRMQLRPQGAVQLVIFFNLLCLACYGLLFFFGCDNIKMAGTTMPYFNSNKTVAEPFKINLTSSCNFGCDCDMNDVQPVCGANGLTYFSPCHAGCTTGGDNFTNCACVLNGHHHDQEPFANPLHGNADASTVAKEGGSDDFAEVTMIPVATSGPCYSQCQMILPFMVLLFFMTLVVAVTQMPVLMVVLRSVEEEEKAFALGIQFVIFRLFGYIPSPILFGSVIDSTCLLWKSTCEGVAGGRCLLYDIEMFRYKYVGVCCGIKVLSVVIFLVDWWLIMRRQNSEKKQTALTVGEVVNSIISLDKLFEPDGNLWVKMTDAEDGGDADGGVGDREADADGGHPEALQEVSEDTTRLEPPSPSKPATELSACLERKAAS